MLLRIGVILAQRHGILDRNQAAIRRYAQIGQINSHIPQSRVSKIRQQSHDEIGERIEIRRGNDTSINSVSTLRCSERAR